MGKGPCGGPDCVLVSFASRGIGPRRQDFGGGIWAGVVADGAELTPAMRPTWRDAFSPSWMYFSQKPWA